MALFALAIIFGVLQCCGGDVLNGSGNIESPTPSGSGSPTSSPVFTPSPAAPRLPSRSAIITSSPVVIPPPAASRPPSPSVSNYPTASASPYSSPSASVVPSPTTSASASPVSSSLPTIGDYHLSLSSLPSMDDSTSSIRGTISGLPPGGNFKVLLYGVDASDMEWTGPMPMITSFSPVSPLGTFVISGWGEGPFSLSTFPRFGFLVSDVGWNAEGQPLMRALPSYSMKNAALLLASAGRAPSVLRPSSPSTTPITPHCFTPLPQDTTPLASSLYRPFPREPRAMISLSISGGQGGIFGQVGGLSFKFSDYKPLCYIQSAGGGWAPFGSEYMRRGLSPDFTFSCTGLILPQSRIRVFIMPFDYAVPLQGTIPPAIPPYIILNAVAAATLDSGTGITQQDPLSVISPPPPETLPSSGSLSVPIIIGIAVGTVVSAIFLLVGGVLFGKALQTRSDNRKREFAALR